MKTVLLTILILGCQIRYDGATPVAKEDAIYPLLAVHQASIEKRYRDGGFVLAEFSPWIHVKSPAAAKLFPKLQFASVQWSERANPASKKRVLGLGLGLEKTLGIDRTTKDIVTQFSGSGNYVDFGKLLVENQIKLRDERDAQLIWIAFCDLHHKHWKAQKHQRISAQKWRLGISRYDQAVASDSDFKTIVTRTHYTLVTVDPDSSQIRSWKSMVETSNKRKVPIRKRQGKSSK